MKKKNHPIATNGFKNFLVHRRVKFLPTFYNSIVHIHGDTVNHLGKPQQRFWLHCCGVAPRQGLLKYLQVMLIHSQD